MKKHGGRRNGAGRKATGSQPFLIRMMPETMGNLRSEARGKGKTVGTLLDWYFGPAWRKPKRVPAKPNVEVSGPPPVTPESKQSATGGFAAPTG